MKVLTAFLKYDYGIEERGVSLERMYFFPAIQKVAEIVIPFWLEDNGFPDDIQGLQRSLIDCNNNEKPDLVFFILMNNEIQIKTIRELNKTTKTINWFCDDQWRFENFSRNIGLELSFIATVDKFSLDKYKNLGCQNVILSQWATGSYKEDLNLDSVNYKYDISFVGGKNLTREWIIYELKKKDINVACFGNGWPKGRVSYEEMNAIFFESKINLNLSNSIPHDISFYIYIVKYFFKLPFISCNFVNKKERALNILGILLGKLISKNVEQIKARNFEIPGCGGFMLSQYALELEDFYEIGKEISIFSTIDELVIQCRYYLANQKVRIDMAKKGYERTKKYSYINRMKNILDKVSL